MSPPPCCPGHGLPLVDGAYFRLRPLGGRLVPVWGCRSCVQNLADEVPLYNAHGAALSDGDLAERPPAPDGAQEPTMTHTVSGDQESTMICMVPCCDESMRACSGRCRACYQRAWRGGWLEGDPAYDKARHLVWLKQSRSAKRSDVRARIAAMAAEGHLEAPHMPPQGVDPWLDAHWYDPSPAVDGPKSATPVPSAPTPSSDERELHIEALHSVLDRQQRTIGALSGRLVAMTVLERMGAQPVGAPGAPLADHWEQLEALLHGLAEGRIVLHCSAHRFTLTHRSA